MAEYKIESGIPIPEVKREKRKYPFPDMRVGDSFEFDLKDHRNVTASAIGYAKGGDLGRQGKFVSRTVAPGRGRIWRVE